MEWNVALTQPDIEINVCKFATHVHVCVCICMHAFMSLPVSDSEI